MIGFLNGMTSRAVNGVITLIGDCVGYEIHVNDDPIPAEANYSVVKAAYWIHEHAPQDAPHELYGFCEREQRDLFRRLLDIKGVGPKVAMAVTASMDFKDGAQIIAVGETDWETRLTRIRGVGRTLAQRIVEAMR